MKFIKYSNGDVPLPKFASLEERVEYEVGNFYGVWWPNVVEEIFPCGCILHTIAPDMMGWDKFYKCETHGERAFSDLNEHEFAWVRSTWTHPDVAIVVKLRLFMRK